MVSIPVLVRPDSGVMRKTMMLPMSPFITKRNPNINAMGFQFGFMLAIPTMQRRKIASITRKSKVAIIEIVMAMNPITFVVPLSLWMGVEPGV